VPAAVSLPDGVLALGENFYGSLTVHLVALSVQAICFVKEIERRKRKKKKIQAPDIEAGLSKGAIC
jgi:hypothetical protein